MCSASAYTLCRRLFCTFKIKSIQFKNIRSKNMEARIWGSSDDGLYEIVSLTKETLNIGMDVMRNAFFMDETVSKACELNKNPEAVQELEELCLRAARDGISLIAVERSTGKAAGAAFNIYQVLENCETDDEYYKNFEEKCKHPGSKQLVQFMNDIAHDFDVFQFYDVESFVEIMFLAVMREHRGHGLAKKLFQCSVELCRKLSNGENVKMSVGVPLKNYPCPQLVAAYCSSFITQKITKSLGFENIHNIDFNKWEFQGSSFAERIGPSTKCTSVDCLLL